MLTPVPLLSAPRRRGGGPLHVRLRAGALRPAALAGRAAGSVLPSARRAGGRTQRFARTPPGGAGALAGGLHGAADRRWGREGELSGVEVDRGSGMARETSVSFGACVDCALFGGECQGVSRLRVSEVRY